MEFDYKEVENCELCGKGFGIMRQRHKCKRCRIIICSDCGKTKAIIIGDADEPDKPHRVCDPCSVDIAFQNDFAKKHESRWNSSSRFGQEWYVYCVSEGMDDDYNDQLNNAEYNDSIQTTLRVLRQDLENGRADRESFNYSLLEFMHYSQQATDRDTVRRNVENVLKAFYGKYRIPYCSSITPIVSFLLTLTEEAKAFVILCFVFERILPRDYWNRASELIPYAGFIRERFILRKFIDEKIKHESNEHKRCFIRNYHLVIDFAMGNLLVNVVNFTTLVHIWHEFVTNKSFMVLQNYVWKVIHTQKAFFEKHANLTIKNFQNFASRNLTPQVLNQHSNNLDPEEKRNFENQYLEFGFNNLLKMREGLFNAHNILSDFEIDQIKALYLEISKLIGEVREKLQEKQVRESIDITKKTFCALFAGVAAWVTDEECEQVFHALDVHETEVVSSSKIIALLVLLNSGATVEEKVRELYRIKDINNEGVDLASALQIVDWLADSLYYHNQLEHTLLFNFEVYDLVERLKRKFKGMKVITENDIYGVVSSSHLKNVLVAFDKRETFELDFDALNHIGFVKVVKNHEKKRRHEDLQKKLQEAVKEEAELIQEEKVMHHDNEQERYAEEAALMVEEENEDEERKAERLAKLEALRAQRETERAEREAERIRQEELRAQRELERQEQLRREEEERLAEIARQEQLRRQQEEERIAEFRRQEELRIAEIRRQEELRRQEQLRREEEARLAEEARQAELRRQEEERLAEIRRQEELRRQEQLRREEEARLAEEARQAELRRQEEERLAEIRRQEELRLAEEQRIQDEQRRHEEHKRLEEQRRQEELRREEELAAAALLAEQQRILEAQRQEELRQAEIRQAEIRQAEIRQAEIRAQEEALAKTARELAEQQAQEEAKKKAHHHHHKEVVEVKEVVAVVQEPNNQQAVTDLGSAMQNRTAPRQTETGPSPQDKAGGCCNIF